MRRGHRAKAAVLMRNQSCSRADLAVEVSSLSSLSPGDVIGWNWAGDTNLANIDHDTIYLGNGVLAAHSASHLDVSATTYYQGSYPQLAWHLIHILNKADTIPPTVAISSPTNGQTFTSSTIAVSGTANDAGCPSTGVALVQAQMNGTGGTWQTASGTNNWSASASLNSGANTIYVRSRDVAGNYSTVASVNVTYTPPDTQGPALAITSPANNATVTSASLPVSGTASDSGYGNNGVSSVTVRSPLPTPSIRRCRANSSAPECSNAAWINREHWAGLLVDSYGW